MTADLPGDTHPRRLLPQHGTAPRHGTGRLRRAWLGAALCLAACGGADTPDATPDAEGVDTAGVLDGGQLFQAHCALCHGANGDGQGAVAFDRPARSFVEGAFSFGNTPEALARSVKHGIGGTPMIGFAELLSDEQIAAVVQHVIDLGPEREATPTEEQTRMTVGERAVVVRGGLPPIVEGKAGVARGLLVGNTDGLTAQYQTQPMQLLGIRQGLFVDRKDWQSRGGDVLQPLGQLVYRFGAHPQAGAVHEGADWVLPQADQPGQWDPVPVTFAGTHIEGDFAWVEYRLALPAQEEPVRVREKVAALSLGGWSGFRRTFEFSAWSEDWRLDWADDVSTQWTGPPTPRENLDRDRDSYLWMRYRTHEESSLMRVSHPPAPLEGGGVRRVEDYLFGLKPEKAAMEALWEAYL